MGSVDGCGLVFQKKLYALCIAPAILILSRLWILSCVCIYMSIYIQARNKIYGDIGTCLMVVDIAAYLTPMFH
jgi:hypothetical protein